MRLGREVRGQQLFLEFRELAGHEVTDGDSLMALVRDFRRHADLSLELERRAHTDRGTPGGDLLYRAQKLELQTLQPVLLAMFGAPLEAMDEVRRDRLASIIDSWIMRRTMVRLSTRGYSTIFVELLSRLLEDPERADDEAEQWIGTRVSEVNRWPTDDELREALEAAPVYRQLGNRKLVPVLEAVERSLHSGKTEDAHISTEKLTVEHVLPQSWEANWPVPDDMREERRQRVHRLGNLTLVNGKLNPALSNAAWPQKRSALHEHSILLLNSRLVGTETSVWDEAAIDERTAWLLERIESIWPRFGPEPDPELLAAERKVTRKARSAGAAKSIEKDDLESALVFGSPNVQAIVSHVVKAYRDGDIDGIKMFRRPNDKQPVYLRMRPARGGKAIAYIDIQQTSASMWLDRRSTADIDDLVNGHRTKDVDYGVRIWLENPSDGAVAVELIRRAVSLNQNQRETATV